MANTGLLILTNPARVVKLLPVIKKHVLKTLYIQYFPEKAAFTAGRCVAAKAPLNGPGYAQTIASIYTVTSSISSRLDIRVLLSRLKNPTLSVINTKRPIEVVIFDDIYSKTDTDKFIQSCLSNLSKGCKIVTFQEDQLPEKLDNNFTNEQNEKIYKNVVLGGTFDRLHNGHKTFLTEAALRCYGKLSIGVTNENMLSGKKLLWELIEPCSKRILGVRDFLEDVDSTIEYNVFSISDMYGPTRNDPSFEMIVVSEETKKGGDKVNQERRKNNLNQLDVHVVKLLSEEEHREHEENRISSSNQRIRLLGTHLKPSNPKFKSAKPYIIGLTGGIGSGKSSVADKLGELGAGVVNCDKLAHELYLPGNRCYKAIVQTFGSTILKPDGFIDRKVLGGIVFHDKAQLNRLNSIVWPMVLEDAKIRIEELYARGFNVIVMEAAVLIQAKWQDTCHEIWTCIIPEEEAIRRVMERNFTEPEAKARISAQPSNVEQVNEANVVICTLWHHDITRGQLKKGWDELMEFLSDNTAS